MDFTAHEISSAPGECIIKVVGVGGCGSNAVGHMVFSGLQGVTFIAADTDAQALAMIRVGQAVKLGPEGFFERSGPMVGQWVAEYSLAAVKDAIGEAHLVFIVAGMGGSTGTGAAPIIAEAAKETGALTVGVVTRPWRFEGRKRMETAEAGIAELYRHVDSLVVLPCEHLYQAGPEQGALGDIFKQADGMMAAAVGCVSDALARPGCITLGLADVAGVLRGGGMAVMGIGAASGENRARAAVMQALGCPLLEGASLGSARGVLLTLTAGPALSLAEVNDAYAAILDETREDALIGPSVVLEESMGDEMRVAFIATTSSSILGSVSK